MENSRKILFPHSNDAIWFVVKADQWLGPLKPQEILDKIENRELTWAHFAWKEGQEGFKRIYDLDVMKVALPPMPSQAMIRRAPKKPPPFKEDTRAWFLYYNDTQFGPFAKDEVTRLLQVGQIHRRVHAWREGLESWARIDEIPEFHLALESIKKESPELKERIKERRVVPRKPLLARILFVKDKEVITGVCRDISVGGMQVLTEKSPADPGTAIKLNVTPDGFKPFVADAVVVRILEDKRGFSLRFEQLSDETRRAIENYISSQD